MHVAGAQAQQPFAVGIRLAEVESPVGLNEEPGCFLHLAHAFALATRAVAADGGFRLLCKEGDYG